MLLVIFSSRTTQEVSPPFGVGEVGSTERISYVQFVSCFLWMAIPTRYAPEHGPP